MSASICVCPCNWLIRYMMSILYPVCSEYKYCIHVWWINWNNRDPVLNGWIFHEFGRSKQYPLRRILRFAEVSRTQLNAQETQHKCRCNWLTCVSLRGLLPAMTTWQRCNKRVHVSLATVHNPACTYMPFTVHCTVSSTCLVMQTRTHLSIMHGATIWFRFIHGCYIKG